LRVRGGSGFRLDLLELLKFGFLFVLKLSNLLNDSLEDLVRRHVIEFSKSGVNSFGVMEGDIFGPVASEDTLRLASEHDLFDSLYVTIFLPSSSGSFLFVLSGLGELELVVHDSLLLVSLASVVTALHQLLH
jgi:hypothetical protein